ncbi:MAG: virulence-associated E family protein [Bacteroidales bacterium]|nr:virulence-associated E family protein [Bacteroidales bacterium]
MSEAIDKFLPEAYEATANEGRYTYRLGSVAGGLVTYEDKFAYSHHDTDPASRQLCNAFDLVRIHLFGDADDRAKGTEDVTKLPSFAKMTELAARDGKVTRLMQNERSARAREDFEGFGDDGPTDETEYGEWMNQLDKRKDGSNSSNANNILLVLRNDLNLRGKLWHDDFSGYDMADRTLPWNRTGDMWDDKDDANLRVYLEQTYGITGKEKISDALDRMFTSKHRHPVREYLDALEWDGVERLDRIIIDYIGAEDNELNRQMSRKQFTAAVRRVFEPGCKFDYCLIMTGGEGIGKSTLLKIMGGDWFSDSVVTTEGKEGMESLRQSWIIELAELASIKRSDVEQVKCFISKREDKYRQAYGKRVTEFKRQCVFFGTTNEATFLKGDTGNRRFWVIPVSHDQRKMEGDIFERLKADRDQLWAEAVHYHKAGERLYLEPEMEAEARKRQSEFNIDVDDPLPGMLEEYLAQRLPPDWYAWDTARRRAFFQNRDPLAAESMEREKFFAGEFLYEMYGYTDKDKDYKYKLKQVNKLMREKAEWDNVSVKISGYGVQKGYRKVTQKVTQQGVEGQ